MEYLLLTCTIFALATGVNSASVYVQKRFKVYDRWRHGWVMHTTLILPAWIVFLYLLVNLNDHYQLTITSSPVIGYFLYGLAALLFTLSIRAIGLQALANGNWFGRGKITHSGVYKIAKNPIYISYLLMFTGAGLTSGNAAYFIIALESFIGLNIIESHIEQIKE